MKQPENYWKPKKLGTGPIAQIGVSFGDTVADSLATSYKVTSNPVWKPNKKK